MLPPTKERLRLGGEMSSSVEFLLSGRLLSGRDALLIVVLQRWVNCAFRPSNRELRAAASHGGWHDFCLVRAGCHRVARVAAKNSCYQGPYGLWRRGVVRSRGEAEMQLHLTIAKRYYLLRCASNASARDGLR